MPFYKNVSGVALEQQLADGVVVDVPIDGVVEADTNPAPGLFEPTSQEPPTPTEPAAIEASAAVELTPQEGA